MEEILEVLAGTDEINFDCEQTFISLDVVSLYPSIPLDFGINCALEFAECHWDKIDNIGISIEQLKTALRFML